MQTVEPAKTATAIQAKATQVEPFFAPAGRQTAGGKAFFGGSDGSGNGFFKPGVQPAAVQAKLSIGAPGDKYEQEADRMAERVVSQSAVQRQELPEEEEKINRKPLIKPMSIQTFGELIQRVINGDITQMTITEEWANDLNDIELLEQKGVLENSLRLLNPGSPEYITARSNHAILESELVSRRLNPALAFDNPSAASIHRIDVTPQMPAIPVRARIQGINPDPTVGTDFNWRALIREDIPRSTCASARLGVCESRVAQNGIRGGSWTPVFPTNIGGNVTFFVDTLLGGSLLVSNSINVEIRGNNPSPADITALAGGAGTDADRVACHESGRRQFNVDGTPLLGPGGDVGVMQLCNPSANCEQRWNWRANVNAGMVLLTQKRGQAIAYLNTHKDSAGNFPNSLSLSNNAVIQRETLQRYNGGHFWVWNGVTHQWEPAPPNSYVSNVLSRC